MDSMRTLALTWLDALELRLLADSKVCVLATEFVVTCRSPMLRRNLQSSTSPKPSMRLTYIPQTTNGSSSSRIFVKVAEASRSRFGKLRLADQLLIVKFETEIEKLNQRVEQQARERFGARLLMTHPGVGP